MRIVIWTLVIGLSIGAVSAEPRTLEPPFTYQGQLKLNGQPVTGMYDMLFKLYDVQSAGVPLREFTYPGVEVEDGLFTVDIDFGFGAFNGDWRWIEVCIGDGMGGYTTLSPRQQIQAAPYALFAFNSIGGGSSPWLPDSGGIYYPNGTVGIGDTSSGTLTLKVVAGDGENAVYARADYKSAGYALIGISEADEGCAVFGRAESSTGLTMGVYGEAKYNGYAGYFSGRGYFSDNLGIGVLDPSARLDVAGLIKTTGFQLTTAPASGYVLTSDEFGNGSWQPAAGGSSLWSASGSTIYYNAGRVGIGTATPGGEFRLHVVNDSGWAIAGNNTSENMIGYLGSEYAGVHGEGAIGVYGYSESQYGRGVDGYANSTTGDTAGVRGFARSPQGSGVYGSNSATTGNAIGVYGATGSSTGFGGYFVGQGYFSNNLGVGTASPSAKLHVAGDIRANNIQLVNGASSGHVLTSDGSGNATWQAPTGGGDSPWTTSGSDIYYASGNVGINYSSPQAPLHVAGGNWDVANGEGDFKIGTSTYRLKMGVGTSGLGAGTCRIFAGGTGSKIILGANGSERLTVTNNRVGIGTTSPSTDLDVAGTIETNGFRLTSSPTSGYVLTCDSSGNGTWQEATGGGGLTLPYSGSLSDNDPGMWVINNGTGMGLWGDGGSCGVKGESDDGYGVWGYSVNDRGVYGSSTNGAGVRAWSYGTGVNSAALYAQAANSAGIAVFTTSTSSDANAVFVNKGTGDIIRGFSGSSGGDLVFRVENDGRTSVSVLQITGGSDLSEQFDVDGSNAAPGMVVCIDPDEPGKLELSNGAYDRRVAGIISGAGGVKPGMRMGQEGTIAHGEHPVALTGRVYVWADATNGPIEPGDMLTTANVPGHAMKVTDHTKAQGAILGKAMSSLDEGRGLVLVLVTLQ